MILFPTFVPLSLLDLMTNPGLGMMVKVLAPPVLPGEGA
jgi:hypothetical protein